jgi:hypothetical protein
MVVVAGARVVVAGARVAVREYARVMMVMKEARVVMMMM